MALASTVRHVSAGKGITVNSPSKTVVDLIRGMVISWFLVTAREIPKTRIATNTSASAQKPPRTLAPRL